MNILNLKAHRCPDAMVMVRISIEALIAEHSNEIEILTIEPMLMNHINAYLAAHSLKAEYSIQSEIISEQQFDDWRNMDEAFDDDDFENCINQHAISLKLTKPSSV